MPALLISPNLPSESKLKELPYQLYVLLMSDVPVENILSS
jgi:hypothetical protein